jgi:hypothetical protein
MLSEHEQTVSATRFLTLSCGEKGCEVCQPLLAASQKISWSERVGERLQPIGGCAFYKCVGKLLEPDAALAQATGKPVVLIEAETGGKRKVGAYAHEHSSPVSVINVEVVLNDPALSDLEMPSVPNLIATPGSPRTVREPLDSYGSRCPAVAMA